MDRKKGDVKYQTTQTGETGKAELFRIYLAECRGPFGLFLLFCCIFACVFYLYRLPAEAVLYATALCIFPTAAVLHALRRSEEDEQPLRGIERRYDGLLYHVGTSD